MAELSFGAHHFNLLNTSVGSHSCSLEIGNPPALMHPASGEGGIERVEISLHGLGPWGEQMKEKGV